MSLTPTSSCVPGCRGNLEGDQAVATNSTHLGGPESGRRPGWDECAFRIRLKLSTSRPLCGRSGRRQTRGRQPSVAGWECAVSGRAALRGPMRDRRATLQFLSRKLGTRDLIWGGLRADDVEAISDLEQVAGSFSIIGGRDRGGAVPSLDFEDLFGAEWTWTPGISKTTWIPLPRTSSAMPCLADWRAPPHFLPYRPSNFLSSIVFLAMIVV